MLVKSYCASARKQEEAGILSIDLTSKKKGNVGRKSTLTEPLKDIYRAIVKEFPYTWKRLTHRTLRAKLSERGHRFCLKTVQNHHKVLKARHKTFKLKSLLTDIHKENRLRFIMDQVDCKTQYGRQELKFRDHLDTIMVDESWIYLMRNDNKLMLIEDIDVVIAPQVVTQSSQSPDLNILDLGFFHSLQSKVHQMKSHCTDRAEFMNWVQDAWDEYPMETLDGIWRCLYNNYRSIMACNGGNQ